MRTFALSIQHPWNQSCEALQEAAAAAFGDAWGEDVAGWEWRLGQDRHRHYDTGIAHYWLMTTLPPAEVAERIATIADDVSIETAAEVRAAPLD
jgi:hypothetical protein